MKYKFEDIIFNITEKKKPVEEDKYNYIGLEHLESGNLFISKWGSDTAPEGEKIVMKKGDVLFGKRRAYQKKVAISPIDGIFSAHGMVLRPKEDVICKEFLPFFISSETFLNEAIRISVGGLSPTVNWKDIRELEFDLPSLAEQKVLAEKLWAAYEVKQSYLKMIAATEEMVKAQFVEMFGTPENNHKDYPIIIIGEKVKSINYGTSKPATDNGKYVYLRMNNITYDGKLDLSEVKRIDLSPEEDESAFVHKGDLMFNRTNTKEFVGKTTVFNLDEPMVVAGYIIRIRFNDDFSPEYVSGYLNSIYGKALLRKMAKGAVHQANINAQEFQRIRILDVPKQEQDKFDTILHQADKSISELRRSVDAIDKVIKSLINENL